MGEEAERKKWGTHVMGAPAKPTAHPANQEAALWKADEQQRQYYHDQPYLVYSPLEKPPSNNPLEPVINAFTTWSHKAETLARNIWHNLKTGPSVTETAWGKINLTAKALSEGGFEALFKQIFQTQPDEKLIKTFACYLSTTTGPVAGTLYLSNVRVGFCSDRPLSFIAPSGQEAWSYYKVNMQGSASSRRNDHEQGTIMCSRCNIEGMKKVSNSRQNPGRMYAKCLRCEQFLGWVDEANPSIEKQMLSEMEIVRNDVRELKMMLKILEKGQSILVMLEIGIIVLLVLVLVM